MLLWKQVTFWLFNIERNISIGKKTKDGEHLFKAIGDRFWLTSESYSWFNKVVHGQPSIKRTSKKGKWYVNKSRLDIEFVKKITLEIVIGQKMKEEGLDQNY